MSDSSEVYTHRSEFSIIETHYGLLKPPFDRKDEILIHRGNSKMDLDENPIPFGLPHIPGTVLGPAESAIRCGKNVLKLNVKIG